ncbi:DUF3685 domain-containing protein [Microcoleus sp. FACHB-672]|uniref:DUF3685 domain-containing protein n=1 Tax=Microcoleus sp. FACHB-672 TaxID=2692825 RepID=UPI001686F68D|nr:DUF3685 domain-containing protein [Microcoleus sp. FACHB-672]MBD2040539.1 DUF3685 domain-containing protein [Microcoleus sp. FACHB-672]
MSERSLKLLLIDDDPIFRIGLRTVCEQFPDLQVVAEAAEGSEALRLLEKRVKQETGEPANQVDLVILELGSGLSAPAGMPGLTLCDRLTTQYPQVSVLVVSAFTDLSALAAARRAGVKGFCPKGTATAELIAAIRQVAGGGTYWSDVKSLRTLVPRQSSAEVRIPAKLEARAKRPLANLRRTLSLPGLRQIDATIESLTAQLQNPAITDLDRAVLLGRRRELRAARWLVNQVLAPNPLPPAPQPTSASNWSEREDFSPQNSPEASGQISLQPTELDPEAGRLQRQTIGSEMSYRALRSELFEATLAKLNSSLPNLTSVTLEIDILRAEKKQELLSIILRQLEEMLDELRFSEVQAGQISEKKNVIVRDLWEGVTTEFFGKFYTLLLPVGEVEVVPVFLQEEAVVQSAILNKIPQVAEFIAHVLFKTPLKIDNLAYPAGSTEALLRAEALLHNLVIQVANAVVQPLLNYFPDVEEIKQSFYDRRWISTRSIEKFRNNLSWKYRLEKYFGEPTAIFESRYWLFLFTYRGIGKIPIYAPRREELMQLSGIPLAVTLVLESRDAVAPRLRSAVAFAGNGVVYVLTQVIGRGLGLIGRGIIQGIGSSWQESKFNKSSQRQK